ncbi:MAG: alpha/beta hydrolase [Pseudomonadota bacterium]
MALDPTRENQTAENIPESIDAVTRHGDIDSLTIDGTRIAFWRVGDHPRSVVFIHGNSACKEVFFRQFDAFAGESVSMVAIDLPGHGASMDASEPAKQYTIPGYARLVQQVLKALDVERPLLVGWSLGGHIAIEMAAGGVDAAGLLIVGTPPAGPGMEQIGDAFLPSDAGAVTMLEKPTAEQIREYTGALYGTCPSVPEWLHTAAARTDGLARSTMGAHWASGATGFSQQQFVAESSLPLCIAHGAEDVFINETYLRQLAVKNLWRDDIQRFEHCGHAAFLEQPDMFNELLRAFINDTVAL